jgi:hypothetical protein
VTGDGALLALIALIVAQTVGEVADQRAEVVHASLVLSVVVGTRIGKCGELLIELTDEPLTVHVDTAEHVDGKSNPDSVPG